ncbi:hypothetical protein B296_00051378 [Ensete ventricosum]|uniref:Uncharacterized protein n=1 Tax=Ensete ventricosum TaxID=4639 RepID=A0A426Y5A0_ENSVE|nr:hypothetical protein B296_00051378 [Ensete ventricosum]
MDRMKKSLGSSLLLPLLISPSLANTTRNQPAIVEIDRYRNSQRRSKSTVTDRFRVVTSGNNCYLAIPPGSGRSTYRSAGGPIHTARYRHYRPVWKTFDIFNIKERAYCIAVLLVTRFMVRVLSRRGELFQKDGKY